MAKVAARLSRVRGVLVLLATTCLLLPGRSHAASALLYGPDGDFRPGAEGPVHVLVHEGGEVVVGLEPLLDVDRGHLLGPGAEVSPGTWEYVYVAPAEAGPVRFAVTLGESSSEVGLRVAAPTTAGITVHADRVGLAGEERALPVRVERSADAAGDPIDAALLEVTAPEGSISAIDVVGGEVVVEWKPGPEPFPRSVPIGVRDTRAPGVPPAWAVLSLRARPRVPIRTEPGAKITLKVGGRSYGPYVARADGVAVATPEVRPGEEIAEVVLTDDAGNTHRSTLTLGGDPRPGLVLVADGTYVVGEAPPVVYAYGVRANGSPWDGADPVCTTSLGQALTTVDSGRGEWQVALPSLPEDAFFDLRVDCHLQHQVRASVRVPVASSQPSRLELRAYPPELDADTPRAQVQAYLENRLGDRLPAVDIQLSAELGEVRVDAEADDAAALRAEYDGTGAVAAGGDTLTAEWNLPSGRGEVWRLRVSGEWSADGQRLVAWGRALDRLGRPLAGIPVELSAGAGRIEVSTDERGWARASIPVPTRSEPVVIEAAAGSRVRRAALLPGRTVGPQPRRADLVSIIELPIRSGRVRGVFLSTEPRTLVTGGADTARVTVRLVGKEGHPVADEPVQLEASEGDLSEPKVRSDGSYEATYTPPARGGMRTVRITATSAGGSFAATTTELTIVPRELHRAPGLRVGYLVGSHKLASYYLGASAEQKLPWGGGRVFGRLSIGYYGEEASFTDTVTDEEVTLGVTLLPIGIGAMTRQERKRLGLWVGASALAVPYRLEARYGEAVPARGYGLASPGFEAYTGFGIRLLNSEIALEASYVFISMDASDVGWEGPLGGALFAVGYRLFY